MILRILIAALGVLSIVACVQTIRLSHAQAARDSAIASLGTCQSANDSLVTANQALQAENKRWADTYAVDAAKSAAAVADLKQKSAAQLQQIEAATRVRNSIYAGDTNAQKWAAAAVPDAIADRLRAPADRPH